MIMKTICVAIGARQTAGPEVKDMPMLKYEATTMPKAIKLPSAATSRPRDFAGLNSLTHKGVVAVLKPFPQPL